jgi:hypothetical protein
MNTYIKYCPNVFVAKSSERHSKGDIIEVTTKYGQIHECEVWNCVGQSKDGAFYYSITRCDGFNAQERAKRKADKLVNASLNAEKKSTEQWKASHEGRDFLALAEPIKVGHHSEKRHRALFERNDNRMRKSVEFSEIAKNYEQRAEYWKAKENEINLSMPESVDFYEYKLEEAKMKHEGLKNGTIQKEHSFSLTYAKKAVNEMEDKFKTAQKLWK